VKNETNESISSLIDCKQMASKVNSNINSEPKTDEMKDKIIQTIDLSEEGNGSQDPTKGIKD